MQTRRPSCPVALRSLLVRAGRARDRRRADPSVPTLEPLEPRQLLATITWDGGPSGLGTNFHDAANWIGGTLPGAADDAVIPDIAGSPVISFTAGATLNSLACSESFSLNSGTLTLAAASQFNASVTFSSGILTGAGALTFGGATTWTGGQFEGTGQLIVAPGGSLAIDQSSVTLPRSLVNSGTVTTSTTDFTDIDLLGAATITNAGQWTSRAVSLHRGGGGASPFFTNSGTFTVQGLGPLSQSDVGYFSGGATLSNSGTISIGAGVTLHFGGDLTHAAGSAITGVGTASMGPGTQSTLTGSANWSVASLVHSGAILVQAGTLTISSASFTNAGVLQVQTGTTLSITAAAWDTEGGGFEVPGGTLLLDGTVTGLAQATFARGGGVVEVRGVVENAGEVLTLDSSRGLWLVNTGRINGGVVHIAGGGLEFVGTANTLDGVTLDGDVAFVASNSGVTILNGLTLNGTMSFSQFTAFMNFIGSQTLGGTGTIHSTTTGNFVRQSTGSTLLIGPGITVAGRGVFGNFGSHLENYGILRSTFGTLDVFNNSFINNGLVDVVGGTFVYFTPFMLAGSGSISITSGTLEVRTPIECAVTLSGGTISTVTGGTLAGGLTWTGGNITGSSFSISIPMGATATLSGGAKSLQTTLENAGTINWTGGSLSLSSLDHIRNLTSGVFNAASNSSLSLLTGASSSFENLGVITKSGTGAWFITGTGQFDNGVGGLLDVQAGQLSVSTTGTSHSLNRGVIDIDSGALFTSPAYMIHASTGSSITGGGTFAAHGTQELIGATTWSVAAIDTINDLTVLMAGGALTVDGAFTVDQDTAFELDGAPGPSVLVSATGSLNVSGAQLTMGCPMVIDGSLTLSGSMLGVGVTTLNGTGVWNSGSVNQLNVGPTGQLNLSSGSTKTINSQLLIDGDVSFQAGVLLGNTNVRSGGTFLWSGGILGASGSLTVASGGLLDLGSGGTRLSSRTISCSGTMVLNGVTLSGGTLQVLASGSVAVSGSSSLSGLNNLGSITIQSGAALTLPGGSSSGLINIASGGALNFNSSFTHLAGGQIAGSGTMSLGNFVHTISGATAWSLPSILFPQGTITGAGNLSLGGEFNWAGGTFSGAGRLTAVGRFIAAANGTLSRPFDVAVAGRLVVADGVTLDVASLPFNVIGGTLFGGTWEVHGALNLPGVSLTSLNAVVELHSAAASFPALSTVAQLASAFGSLHLLDGADLTITPAGPATLAGTLEIGPGSVLTVNGVFAPAATGEILVHLAGTSPNAHGRITASGAATLSGDLVVALAGGFAPTPGDTFAFLGAASRSGRFLSFSSPPAAPGTVFVPLYTGSGADVYFASGVVWDGGPSGLGTNFHDPVNWEGNVLPGPSDIAIIDVPANPTITVTSSTTIGGLLTAEAINQSGGTFTINGPGEFGAAFALTGSAFLNGSGDLTFNAGLNFLGASSSPGLSGAGRVILPAGSFSSWSMGSYYNSPYVYQINRPVELGGVIDWTEHHNILLQDGGSLLILPGGTFNISGVSNRSLRPSNDSSPVLLTNGGTINLTNPGGLFALGTFNSNGVTFLNAPTGVVNINSGTFTVSGSSVTQTNLGLVHIAAGSAAVLNQFSQLSGSTFAGGTWNIAGTLTLPSGSAYTGIAAGAGVVIDGPAAVLTRNGGGSPLSTLSTNAGSLTLKNGAAWGFIASGTFNNSGTFSTAGSGTLAVPAAVTFNNTGTLTIGSDLRGPGGGGDFDGPIVGGGIINIRATLTLDADSTFTGQVNHFPTGTRNGAAIWTVNGTYNWFGGTMDGTGRTLVGSTNTLNMVSGVMLLSGGHALENLDEGIWTGGCLALNAGTFINGFGANLTITGVTEVLSQGGTNAFVNDGDLTITDDADTDFGSGIAYSNSGSWTIDAPVFYESDQIFDSLVVITANGLVSGPGNLTFNADLDWQGGGFFGPGFVTVAPGGLLSMSGEDDKLLDTTFNHDAVGGIWTGGCLNMASALAAFNNGPGATLDIFANPQIDVNGPPTAQFNNAAGALITVHTGEFVIHVGGTNSGTIIVIPPDTLIFTVTYTHAPGSMLTGPGGVAFLGGIHTFASGTFTVEGPVTLGPGASLTLPAASLPNYNATTHVFSGGDWSIGDGALLNLSGAEIWTIDANTSFTLSGNAIFTALNTLSTINGSLTLTGGRDLAVNPADPITAGSLVSNGAITLDPGSTLSTSGGYTQTGGASLNVRFSGNDAATMGVLSTGGPTSLAGHLDIAYAFNYTPPVYTNHRFLATSIHSSLTGAFATTSIPTPGTDLKAPLITDAKGMRLLVSSIADWNNDADVGVPDIFAFLASWFAGNADINNDGSTNVPDIFAFLSRWFAAP